MIGATFVGIVLVREGDWPIGVLVVIGSVAMLVPWTAAWLVFGGAWTAIGVLLVVTWSARPDDRRSAGLTPAARPAGCAAQPPAGSAAEARLGHRGRIEQPVELVGVHAALERQLADRPAAYLKASLASFAASS